ncbi:MAG: hypothetical protein H7281_00050 [Bacteriovorax sp.]|nr:hypothetical protein [Bacteriovorax sp.]
MNLLIMGSDTVQIKQKLVRMDVLYIISPKGEILKKFSFQQSLDFLIKNNILSEDTFDQIPENSSYTENHLELLHVNSFYQIPKQNKINSNKFFKENNYVVNSSNASHVFVLNESLDKIVALIPKVKDKNRIKFFSIIHDVQPTPNGELIVYNNYNVHDKNPLSKIEIYDSNFEKTLFSYTRENPERFLSKIAGGVQFFSDGTFLYSEIINDHSKVHYINKKGELIKTFNIKWPSLLKGVQEMKAYDLASFIKFNIPY